MEGLLQQLHQWMEIWRGDPMLPFVLFGLFIAVGIFHISPWIICLQAGAMLKPQVALLVSYAGVNVGANIYFLLGRLLGERLLKRWIPARVTAFMNRSGLESVFLVRVVPLLPFYAVNLAFGASGMRWGHFALATAVGVIPVILVVVLLGDRAIDVILHPTASRVALLLASVAGLGLLTWGLRRAIDTRQQKRTPQ
jgi:uncharacterized membrane protein YdjX (TVP38/TMEM64 family)